MAFDPLSAAGGLVAGLGDAFLNNRFSLKSQHQAQDFSENMYKHRYQWQVEDMKKAGINPMMSYMSGAPSGPSSSAAASKGSNVAGSINDTRIASAQEANLAANTKKQLQEADTSAALSRNYEQDTLLKGGMLPYYSSLIVHETASAKQADAATAKIRAEIPQVENQIKEIQQQIKKSKSDVNLNNSLIQANEYLNSLRLSEKFLTNARVRNTGLEGDILSPKAKAAKTATAEIGHTADNIGKIGSAAWKFMFPTLSNGGH